MAFNKRKNKEKDIKVYSYHTEIIGDPPEQMWKLAHAMREMWNDLVEFWEKTIEASSQIEDTDARKEIWKKHETTILEYYKSDRVKSALPWYAREAVFERFRTASARIAKAIKEWRAKKTRYKAFVKPMPRLRKRFRLESIMIPHRFTGGGKEVARFYNTRAKSFTCREVLPELYESNKRELRAQRWSNASFGVDGEIIPLRVLMHRQLPPDAIVKIVSLVGVYNRLTGWKWKLNITVEDDPVRISPEVGRRRNVCGLDLGWRKLDDARLRIGVFADNNGRTYEIILPLKPKPEVDNIVAYTSKLRQKADNLKDSVKAELMKLGVEKKRLEKMGFTGLRRLLQEEREKEQPVREMISLLEKFTRESDELLAYRHKLEESFAAKRRWLYGNIAHALCSHYEMVIWEDKLNLKEMVTLDARRRLLDSERIALNNSMKYQRLAALAEFRQIIARVSRMYSTEIVGEAAKDTSAKCHICGGSVQTGASLVLECENEHRFDQDENSGWNLLLRREPMPARRGEAHDFLEKIKLGSPAIKPL